MKILIKSKFHGTEKVFSIKSRYFGKDQEFDALSSLDYEVYSRGNDYSYSKNKLSEIKKALCGQTDCKCVFHIN